MVDRICVVLEALSIAVCLHRLYGKKFRFDIATVSLMTIEMIMMQAIDYFNLSSKLSVWFTPVIWIYCVIEFRSDLKNLIINNILNSIIICVLQVSVMMIFYLFDNQKTIVGMHLLFSNTIVLIIVGLIFPQIKVRWLIEQLKDKEKNSIIATVISISIIVFWLINFKNINFINHFEFLQYILFAACIIMICALIIKMGKYRIKSKEAETELKVHQLYANSFDNLIDNIRSKQHEFDNHINTIYSQHYIYKTYEELVEAQKGYCQVVSKENKFNKILNSGNRIIIGFLYGRFIEIDKLGVDISYHINIEELNVGVPIYKLVEVLGNLIANAVEAMQSVGKYHRLYVYMEENEEFFLIEIRNESDYITYSEIELFFAKGYSKKGENRGLGLFHVKAICDEYKLNLSCQNKEVDKINWISFSISNKKETT